MLSEQLIEVISRRYGHQLNLNLNVNLNQAERMVVGDLRFTPLSGTHQVWECAFEVNAQTQRVIVKQLHEHDGQAFSFASTFALQQRLFAMGMAAEPIYLGSQISSCANGKSTGHDLLWVEAFVPAADTEQSATSVQSLTLSQTLARALAQLHKAPIDTSIRLLDPINQCKALISNLHTSNVTNATNATNTAHKLTQELDTLLNDMQQLTLHHNEPVLCHNDLHLSHVRADYTCVDWEYAAMGPRYFDVAMCVVINQLSNNEQTQLFTQYAQLTQKNIDEVAQQTALYIRLALIINHAWALLL
jgi:hypothetical protein